MGLKKLSTYVVDKNSSIFSEFLIVFHRFPQIFIVDNLLITFQHFIHMWKVWISILFSKVSNIFCG